MVTRAAAAGRATSRTAAVELHTACAPTTTPAAAPCPSGLHILREGTLLQVRAGGFSILCPGRRPTAADQKPPARMHILASIRTPLWSCGGAPCLVPTPQGRSLHLPLVSLNGRSEASAVWGWGQASDRGYQPAQQRHFGCLYPRRRRWAPHGRARRHLRRWWPSRHVYAFETRSIRQFSWYDQDARPMDAPRGGAGSVGRGGAAPCRMESAEPSPPERVGARSASQMRRPQHPPADAAPT